MTSVQRHLHDELIEGLAAGQLLLAYQPAIDLRSGQMAGVEALIRWNHPREGLLWPGDFLPQVADPELIAAIGAFVLEEAARQSARWRRFYPVRPFGVIVNISAEVFAADGFAGTLAASLAAHHLEPQGLTVEVGERTLFADLDHSREQLTAIAETGVAVTVDDFGTTYARGADAAAPGATTDGLLLSLVTLEDAPVDAIKIDRRLLERLFTGASDAPLVDAVVRLTHRLGFQVQASGVESAEEAEMLRAAGCDVAQGYHFHRPQSPEYIEILLREARDAREPGGPTNAALRSALTR